MSSYGGFTVDPVRGVPVFDDAVPGLENGDSDSDEDDDSEMVAMLAAISVDAQRQPSSLQYWLLQMQKSKAGKK